MNRITRCAAVAVALAIAASAAWGAGTKLVYKPKKGDTGKYKYVMTSEATGVDPETGKKSKIDLMSTSAYAVFRDTVTAVTDKGATSSFKFDAASVRMMGTKSDVTEAVNKAALKATFGPDGLPVSVVGVDKLDITALPLAGVLGTAMQLPAKAVSVGTTWKSRQNAGMPGASSESGPAIETQLRFAGIETRGGRLVAKIVLKVDCVIDLSKMGSAQGGQTMKGKITAKGSGTGYVDVATGKPVELTSTLLLTMPAEMTGMGALEVKVTTNLKRTGN